MSGRIANKLVALDDYVLYNGDMSSFVPRSSLDLRPIAVGPVARLPRTAVSGERVAPCGVGQCHRLQFFVLVK